MAMSPFDAKRNPKQNPKTTPLHPSGEHVIAHQPFRAETRIWPTVIDTESSTTATLLAPLSCISKSHAQSPCQQFCSSLTAAVKPTPKTTHNTMPVFTENSGRDRDARILPSRELPLPRISQRPTAVNTEKQREVVVIGVRFASY
jgi:hypothetical protein